MGGWMDKRLMDNGKEPQGHTGVCSEGDGHHSKRI